MPGDDASQLSLNFGGSQMETYLKVLTRPDEKPSGGGLALRTYLALVRENPGIELGLEGTRPSPGLHVIMGYY